MLDLITIGITIWEYFFITRAIDKMGALKQQTGTAPAGQPPPIRVAAAVPLRNLRPAFGPTWGELGSASARVGRRVMRVALLFVMVLIAIVVFAVVLGLSISR